MFPGLVTNPDIDVIRRAALKSNHDWLVWRDHKGIRFAARRSAVAIKRAMLDSGTSRKFTLYCARSVMPMAIGWRQALILRKNTLRGY